MTPTFADSFETERYSMVDAQLRKRGILDERVLAAMARVPRHEFVSQELRAQAYEDHPILIGEGQTISQPYIVAFMLDALRITPNDTLLEIGTGSGYLTAILAELGRYVYSLERHSVLATAAEAKLGSLGYRNIDVIVGDGSKGLPEHAPFDRIIVSAAAPRIPKVLFEQLEEGGRMVIPVGPAKVQELKLVRKQDGQSIVAGLENCRFVPLIGVEGYSSTW
ncbi:MAG TPA: protein-L-isoaspartate(D-aspartate) O-methyltransferase [Terriglobales bacterium]|nr:protein-L-isoaspartate(D-aspartate) O-methyltransferase [Terriglobales bacterium]